MGSGRLMCPPLFWLLDRYCPHTELLLPSSSTLLLVWSSIPSPTMCFETFPYYHKVCKNFWYRWRRSPTPNLFCLPMTPHVTYRKKRSILFVNSPLTISLLPYSQKSPIIIIYRFLMGRRKCLDGDKDIPEESDPVVKCRRSGVDKV